jgi:protein tyrosine phosphatase
MTEIQPGIFLGGQELSKDYSFLKSKRITHILSIGSDFTEVFPHQFTYKIVVSKNNPTWNFYKHFNSIAQFIKDGSSGKNVVYVHCGSGNGKGTTALITYFLRFENMSIKEALSIIRIKNPSSSPKECKFV